jgi:uncharacterized protein (TIGR02145 family)
MKYTLNIIIAIAASLLNSACQNVLNSDDSVKDSVIKVSFKEVKIGNQIWMVENLNLDTFRNGEPIPEAKSDEEWLQATINKQPAWCYYENNPENGKKFGRLYNWYAVADIRKLAPKGWHIPSREEWNSLDYYLGENNVIKLKSKDGWFDKEGRIGYGNGTNESGFSALSSGSRWYGRWPFEGVDQLSFRSELAAWWSTTESGDRALMKEIGLSNQGRIYYDYEGGMSIKGEGHSVRCIKD